VRSYRQLPLMLYQFGTKFRDEIRPRFGVMRAREFLMKDAYSFHTDEADSEAYYKRAYDAYNKICTRCGFKFRAVEATTGAIGGSFSHEFMVLADTGEETIANCECGYGANLEKAECKLPEPWPSKQEPLPIEEVHTPNLKSVEEVGKFMRAKPNKFIKTLIYVADGTPVIALVRGDYEVNEHKLRSVLDAKELNLADEAVINKVTGAPCGFAGPNKLADKTVKIVADHSVTDMVNAVTGANKQDYHCKNININRDYTPNTIADIRNVVEGDKCKNCGKDIKFCRGIEVGHTFKLGTKYSKSMNAVYLTPEGKENLMIMGCYGIGVSRILAATIEQSHDENGIIWPIALAPFKVSIVAVDLNHVPTKEAAEKLYAELTTLGLEVLLDDRDERAGVKFKDADLMGIPLRVTISEKTLAQNSVEFKLRHEDFKSAKLIALDKIVEEIRARCKASGL